MRRWPRYEEVYLMNSVEDKLLSEVAEILGKTKTAVSAKAARLGLVFRHKNPVSCNVSRPRLWVRDEEMRLVTLIEKYPVPKIAEEMNRSVESVLSKLSKMGLRRMQGAYSAKWISKLLGVSEHTVGRHIDKLGFKRFPGSDMRTDGFIREERYVSMIAQSIIDTDSTRLKVSYKHLKKIADGNWDSSEVE